MIVPTGLPNPRDLLVGKPLDFSKFHDFAEDVWKAPDGLSHLFDGDPAQESLFRVEGNGIEQHLFREILALAAIPRHSSSTGRTRRLRPLSIWAFFMILNAQTLKLRSWLNEPNDRNARRNVSWRRSSASDALRLRTRA